MQRREKMVRFVLYAFIFLGLLPSLAFGEQRVQGPESSLNQKTSSDVKIVQPNKLDKRIVLGKWHSTSVKDEFPFYAKNDYDESPVKTKRVMLPPAPITKDNIKKWIRVKGIEDTSQKMDPLLKPYSVSVPKVGYSILSISKAC
jgi:hypothetical protein